VSEATRTVVVINGREYPAERVDTSEDEHTLVIRTGWEQVDTSDVHPTLRHAAALLAATDTSDPGPAAGPIRRQPRPGRNEPCECGSGKKRKRCCGRLT
jgi:hypothetical protein